MCLVRLFVYCLFFCCEIECLDIFFMLLDFDIDVGRGSDVEINDDIFMIIYFFGY